MKELEKYENILKSSKELFNIKKAIVKHQNTKVDYMQMTQSQIGKYQDTMTRLAFDFDKAIDNLHADLVDANMTPMKEDYSTRLISHTHGCGRHTYTFKYTPKIPKKFT